MNDTQSAITNAATTTCRQQILQSQSLYSFPSFTVCFTTGSKAEAGRLAPDACRALHASMFAAAPQAASIMMPRGSVQPKITLEGCRALHLHGEEALPGEEERCTGGRVDEPQEHAGQNRHCKCCDGPRRLPHTARWQLPHFKPSVLEGPR